jgi:tRNA-2-methylthio-N6-dimethylallyladenosine synthase
MKKIYIKTFGCQMNEYDSDKMADVLNVSEGLIPTSTPEDADVILFNTCSVREKAQEKVFHDLGRVRHLKQANPNLIIGVGGCVASQEGAAIVARAPFVDVVFGPQTLHRLPELIAQRRETGRAQVDRAHLPAAPHVQHRERPPARTAPPVVGRHRRAPVARDRAARRGQGSGRSRGHRGVRPEPPAPAPRARGRGAAAHRD